jgi:hypothetical protein
MQEQGDEMSLKHWQLDINEINNTLRLFKENIYAFVFQQFLYFTTIILLRKRTLPKLSVFNSKITEATTTNEDIIA